MTSRTTQSFAADSCMQLNGLALEKFTKKCDKNLLSSLLPWVRSRLPSEAFMSLPLSRLFVPLGEMYADVRVAAEAVSGSGEARTARGTGAGGGWKPPSSFVRQTTKYWVPYDKVCLRGERVPVMFFREFSCACEVQALGWKAVGYCQLTGAKLFEGVGVGGRVSHIALAQPHPPLSVLQRCRCGLSSTK